MVLTHLCHSALRHVQYSWSEFSVFSFVDIFRQVLGIQKFSPIWQSAVVTMAFTISRCENNVRCLYKIPSLPIPNRLKTNCSMQFDKQLQIIHGDDELFEFKMHRWKLDVFHNCQLKHSIFTSPNRLTYRIQKFDRQCRA